MTASASASGFPQCPICSGVEWASIYSGPVRVGAFGSAVDSEVKRCSGCGVDRLSEGACLKDEAYRGEAYRQSLGQDHVLSSHYAAHDELARFTLETIWPASLRGKIIADIGCGGGSLLDHIRGLPRECIAVDPSEAFGVGLQQRGYTWFPYARDAAAKFANRVDVAFAIQVIEHVDDPRDFLAGIRELLAPGGIAVVSTPNREDILVDLLESAFRSFFYRTQHRWYFDSSSLRVCAMRAGFDHCEAKFVHRYGLSNTLYWLRDKRPRGRQVMPVIDESADAFWTSWLSSHGRTDNLYMIMRASQ